VLLFKEEHIVFLSGVPQGTVFGPLLENLACANKKNGLHKFILACTKIKTFIEARISLPEIFPVQETVPRLRKSAVLTRACFARV